MPHCSSVQTWAIVTYTAR